AEQRDRRHRERPAPSIQHREEQGLVCRPAQSSGDGGRHLLDAHRAAVASLGLEPGAPFILGQVPELGEGLADDPLGRLVEEDERALLVDDRERCGEVGGELASKDQREAFVRSPLHLLSLLRLVVRANGGYISAVPFSVKKTSWPRRGAVRTAGGVGAGGAGGGR